MINFKDIIKVSIKALKTNKTRSFLTMLGIIIGVCAVILLVSIGSGLKLFISSQLETLGVNVLIVIPGNIGEAVGGQKGGMMGAGTAASKLTLEMAEMLKKRGETISSVMPYTENNATMKYKKNTHITQVTGVSVDYPEIRDHQLELGRFFSLSAQRSAKKEVVLGKTVYKELFLENENPLKKRIKISDQNFLVVGVLEEKGGMMGVDMDNQVFIPVTTALKIYGLDKVQAIFVKVKDKETIPEAKVEIKRILSSYLKEEDYSVVDTKSLLSIVENILGALTLALSGIASISLVVGGIGIMNIMLVSVTERTREIGLRKAVGATPKDILIQFLIEAVFLAITGGVIGILLGIGGSILINKFLQTEITLWSIFIAFFISSLVGIIFGVAPAYKAAKLNPIEALRYE